MSLQKADFHSLLICGLEHCNSVENKLFLEWQNFAFHKGLSQRVVLLDFVELLVDTT